MLELSPYYADRISAAMDGEGLKVGGHQAEDIGNNFLEGTTFLQDEPFNLSYLSEV